MNKQSENSEKRALSPTKRLFFLILGIALTCISGALLFYGLKQNAAQRENVQALAQAGQNKTQVDLTWNGVDYKLRDRLETTLVLGIDKFSDNIEEHEENVRYNQEQTDFLVLMVQDKNAGTTRLLQLNRDTMADIDVLGILGDVVDTHYEQLALAHTYGTGDRDSVRNAMRAVSRLLTNIPIDHFVTLTMDAVAIINDGIGGVPVLIEEDFSNIDPSLVMGETITLTGDQALTYVRGRMGVDDGTNLSRMARQQKYLTAFYTKLAEVAANDETKMMSILMDVSDYMTSDLSVNKLADMLSSVLDSGDVELETIDGENVVGEKYMEYYLDDEDMHEKIIDLFYEPVESQSE